VKHFWAVAIFLIIQSSLPGGRAALAAETQKTNGTPGVPEQIAPLNGSGLAVQPGELNLGTLGPGEEASGVLYLKRTGPRSVNWSMEGPEGWKPVDYRKLSGVAGENPEPVRLRLVFVNDRASGRIRNGNLFLYLEAGGQICVYRKEFPVGNLRDAIRFDTAGGARMAFFQVKLSELAAAALLQVTPLRIDLGAVRPGEEASRRVHVQNRGREILKWRAGVTGTKGMPAEATPPAGRYVSFRNEAAAGTGGYSPARLLPDGPELLGNWEELDGYPVTIDEQNILRYRFNGTGISLFMQKTPEGDPLLVYLDQQLVTTIDGFANRSERVEIPIAESQPDAAHLLTLINGGGRVVLEGVRIIGRPVARGPRGWASVFPDSGVTTRETDYITVALNTGQLSPGVYGDHLYVMSNGGEADIELIVEVAGETQPRLLDVHRYLAGADYLYTTSPQEEAARLQLKGYRDLGIAFRLFSSGTAGTIEFYRWYNPVLGDHFYSTEPSGGKPLPGYLFEGSIGNIATIRLSGTKELYRWHNPATGRHFFTTDQNGEGLGKTGYRFNGIAGFVR
jgi:hypothetical protein